MSKDTNELLGHADEADGIEEYDNPLPDWWVGLFWLTVLWAAGYGLFYHFIADLSQEGFLEAEMAAAEARWPDQPGGTEFAERARRVGARQRHCRRATRWCSIAARSFCSRWRRDGRR